MGPRISRICTNFLIARIGFTNWSTNFTNLHESKVREANFSRRRVGEGVLGEGGEMEMLGVMGGGAGGVFFLRCIILWCVF